MSETKYSKTTFRYSVGHPQEYILCAAIHYKAPIKDPHLPKNIASGIVICGRRHHNCISVNAYIPIIRHDTAYVQGFLTNKDRFVDREEGAEIAIAAGQLAEGESIAECLTSEDLY